MAELTPAVASGARLCSQADLDAMCRTGTELMHEAIDSRDPAHARATYVRIVDRFPMTQTNKILKRDLVKQQWSTTEPLWVRRGKELVYEPLTAADLDALKARFVVAGTTARLTA